ncbi:MAG: sulfate permease [Acidobacteria bacterium]|nr:sulfate permease [Acidobacteriota bacterium]
MSGLFLRQSYRAGSGESDRIRFGLVPKTIVCLREGYSWPAFGRDAMAGLVVGIVALPLALAFAIASGVPPERGLYTAIVAGFVISLLGGSRVQIGGPTGAFVIIIAGIVGKHGIDGLAICTMLAGAILLILGLARMGNLIKFIPYPVTTGFTAGIAVVIFSSQVRDLLGLRMGGVPPDFFEKWAAIFAALTTTHWPTVAVAAATLAILVGWHRVSRLVPAPFVAMVAATAAVALFDLPVETVGSRFHSIPAMLPMPSLPEIPSSGIAELVSPAVSIALLAAIESLLSAVVADTMIGTRHDSNQELVAQGVANILSPLFGGIPATGAIARTATNVRAGGRTPFAGMIHALTILLILVLFGRYALMVPLASLAAILVIVAYHMSEWRSFRSLLSAPRSDVAVLLLTFTLTVVVDLTVAVQVGVVAAALLFMKRMSEVTDVSGITGTLGENEDGEVTFSRGRAVTIDREPIPDGIEIYEVQGPFFFGAADKLREVIGGIAKPARVVILRMRHVPAIDATGMHALEQVLDRCRANGGEMILAEVRPGPLRTLLAAGKLRKIGRRNIAQSMTSAMRRARILLNERRGVTAPADQRG